MYTSNLLTGIPEAGRAITSQFCQIRLALGAALYGAARYKEGMNPNKTMKKKIELHHWFPAAACCLLALLLSCASGPQAAPEWARDMEAAYPYEHYLAAKGRGKDAAAALLDAERAIARYLSTSIQDKSKETAVQSGNAPTQSTIIEETFVKSQVELFALEYTEPWYNRGDKLWEAAAFIPRDEAWDIYEPSAETQAGAFLNLVKAAGGDPDPLSAALRYGNAAAYSRSAEFAAVRQFAQALHPEMARDFFGEADRAMRELPEKQVSAAQKAPVFIEAPVDHERLIYQAMVRALASWGFAVEPSRERAGAVCTLQVEEGLQIQDLYQEKLYTYYPSLWGTLRGKSGGALLSFKVEGERQGAVTPAVAKRRAYTALAAALETSFPNEAARMQKALADK
jgi:hypothetical protein